MSQLRAANIFVTFLPPVTAFVPRQFFVASFPRPLCTMALYLFLLRKTLVSLICCEIIAAHHFKAEKLP